MSRDSVAVLRAFEAKFWEVAAKANDRSCDHDVCKEVRDFRALLDRLIREAAPQASGGDGRDADRLHDYPTLLAFFDKHAFGPKLAPSCLCCGESTHGRELGVEHMELPGIVICKRCRDASRLATTDSAIQSQQGATGGAVLRELIAASKEVYRISERNHIAWHRLSAALEAAHPQAAGSAPGEAMPDPLCVQRRSDCRYPKCECPPSAGSVATPAAGAGSAPGEAREASSP